MANEEENKRIDDLLARLTIAEERNSLYGKHILQLHEQYGTLSASKAKEEEIKLVDLPIFEGDGDPDSYLDWERRMDRLFDHKNLDDPKRYSYAILKLTRYASLWLDSMQNHRERDGKARIDTWTELKAKMRKRFVPRSYKQDLYLKLNTLKQDRVTVEAYITEFEKLYIACGCKEEEEQKIAKFILGLSPPIRFQVELQPITTFDEACTLATKVERQGRVGKGEFAKPNWAKTDANTNPHKQIQDFNQKESKVMAELKANQGTPTQGQQKMKPIVCYKCQGMGHIAKQCPNKVLVTREEYYTLLNQNMDEITIDSTKTTQQAFDEDDSDFWENQQSCYPEQESKTLIVRRSLMSTMQDDKDDEQRSNLFHSKCLIDGKVHSFIVDSGSCTNVCALSLIDEHKLPTRKHPHSYKLSWLNDDGVWVKKQALVNFRVGDYVDEVWCDVVPMSACSLLLGRPWQSDKKVMHNGKTNVYSVLHEDKRLLLHPLPPNRSKDSRETTTKTEGHVCFGSCHHELLDCSSNKKERRGKALQMRRGSNLEKGDRVWLSLAAQKLHVDHKNDEPLDEGPFEIVERVGYETFKVLLGNGVCATLTSADLEPCFYDNT